MGALDAVGEEEPMAGPVDVAERDVRERPVKPILCLIGRAELGQPPFRPLENVCGLDVFVFAVELDTASEVSAATCQGKEGEPQTHAEAAHGSIA
jgi:hypothetical protein